MLALMASPKFLFAYASAFANNGQNMAGLSANNIFYNVTTMPRDVDGPICHGRAGAGVSGPLCRNIPATTQSRRHAFRWNYLWRVAYWNRTARWRA